MKVFLPASILFLFLSLNSFSQAELPASAERKEISIPAFSRLRIGFSSGIGVQTGYNTKFWEDFTSMGIKYDNRWSYYRQIKTGMYLSHDVTLMLRPSFGFGYLYKFYTTSAGIVESIPLDDNWHILHSAYREKLYINFVGPSIFFKRSLGKTDLLSVYSTFSVGLTDYRNEAEYFKNFLLITGQTIGFDARLGADCRISERISAGLEVAGFYSKLGKLKYTNGVDNETQELDRENNKNISRVDISLGLRFNLIKK